MDRRAILQAARTVSVNTHIPVRDPILQALKDGATSIDFSEYFRPKEGEHQMRVDHVILGSMLRNYFIHKVKAPLQEALTKLADDHIKRRRNGANIEDTPLSKSIIVLTKLMPEVTKSNTSFKNAHAIIDVIEQFNKYLNFKQPMFQEAFKVLRFELGHDKAYTEAFLILIEEIIKAILRGDIEVRDENPHPTFWSNQTPKGGRHSIISVLQDKKAMENLLGDKWVLKE